MSSFTDDQVTVTPLLDLAKQFQEGGNEFKTSLQKLAQETRDLGGSFSRGLHGLGDALKNGAHLIMAPLTMGIGLIVGALQLFERALKISIEAATKQASALSTIRAQTGLSFNKGFELTSRNMLFGIAPQDTAQMFSGAAMNPMIAGMRGQATGFGSPYDPNYLQKAAAQYQSYGNSPMGRLMANHMLDASYGGQAPESIRQTLNLRPDQIQRQQDYGQNIRGSLGISGGDLKKYAEDIPLAVQRISYAVEMVKVKLAVELAPVIERTLGHVAALIGKNAGKIGKAIEAGVHFLVHDLPPMLLRGGASILRGGAAILAGIGQFALGMAGNVKPMLHVFDTIINGLRSFVAAIAGAVAYIIQAGGALWAGLQKSGIPQLLQWVGSKLTGLPNDSIENKVANSAAGGAAVKVAGPAVLKVGGAALKTGFNLLKNLVIKRGAAAATTVAEEEAAGAVGAAEAAGAVGAGGVAGAAGVGLIGGVTVGYLLDQGAAKLGWLNPDQSFLDRQRRGLGVIADFVTRNPGHYDRESDKAEAAQKAAAAKAVTPSQSQQKQNAQSATNHPKAAVTPQSAKAATAAQGGINGFKAALTYQEGLDPAAAFANGQNAMYGTWAQTNLENNPDVQSTLTKLFKTVGDKAMGGSQSLTKWADQADSLAKNYEKTLAQEQADSLKQIAKNTSKEANDEMAGKLADIIAQFGGRVAAYIAEDAALNTLRI